MNAALLAAARSVPNPFLLNRIDSAWDGSFTDVPEINAAAFQHCQATIAAVRASGQSRGLLLTGEPGSGKSHLLRRLRHALAQDDRDCFIYVPPVAASGRLFGELLRRVVGDMIREPGEGAASQLETLVIRELVNPALLERLTPMQVWADLRARTPAGPALFQALASAFDRLVLRLQLDPDVVLVLRHYLTEHHRGEAYRWLTGYSVPEAVTERLGVSRTLESEDDARQALITLSKLAGRHAVLVLAFDQLEGMQVHPDDLDGIRAFGNAVADLLINCRNIAAVSCVQAYFRADLLKALPPAHLQRIEQDRGQIELLDRDQSMKLVASRLAHPPELEAGRDDAGADALWPLESRALVAALPMTAAGSISARTVIDIARGQYDDWSRGTHDVQVADDMPDVLSRTFDSHVRHAAGQAADEGTLADGLLKLLDVRKPGQVRRSRVRGFDIEWGPQGDSTGVSVCHAMNMTSLAARLRHVAEAVEQQKIRRAVVVRDERLPISETAPMTQRRLRWLRDNGHAVVRPSAAAYAAIAAARALLAESASGDLASRRGRIGVDAVRAWLLHHRPAAAFDVLDELDAPSDDITDEALDRLRSALTGRWLMPVDEACRHADLGAAQLVDRLAGHRLLGLIAGPPALVYVRPDGLQRG